MVSDLEVSEAVSAVQILLQKAEEQSRLLNELLPSSLPGGASLSHLIRTEINVLLKGLERKSWLKLEHVNSSNLHQLGAVVDVATALGNKVDGVLQKYRDENSAPVFVDIVANGGLLWIKVVCRCPNSLQLAHLTGGRAGERPPLEQAALLQRLATQHTVLYTTPKVALVFCKGVSYSVHRALQKQGVLVLTHKLIPDAMLTASRYCYTADDGASSIGDDEALDSDNVAENSSCSEEDACAFRTAPRGAASTESEQSLSESTEWDNDNRVSNDEDMDNFPETHQVSDKMSILESVSISEDRITNKTMASVTSTKCDSINSSSCLRLDPKLITKCPESTEECSLYSQNRRWPMCSHEEISCIAEKILTLIAEWELAATKSRKAKAFDTESEKRMPRDKFITIDSIRHTDTKETSIERTEEVATQSLEVSAPLPGALPLSTTALSPSSPSGGCLMFLDVPCMVAYVSNTTNGHAQYRFTDKFLLEQATWECSKPVKPVIELYWQGHHVAVCEEAVKRFQGIVSVVAGPEERRRAEQLLSSVTVVPDCDALQDAVAVCGGITASARTIFGTAHHYRAPIITANNRFVRSALSQGVRIAALLHSPRALTEQKQMPRDLLS